MLEFLKLDNSVEQEVEKDTLGGGGPLASGVYDLVIKAAYFDQAKSKATSVNLVMETSTGRRVNVTEYITSGEAKGCKPYYTKDGKNYPLPGYSKMNTLCQLVTGKTIDQMTVEDKIFKLYDFSLKQETNQTKKAIMDLIGQPVKAGIFRVIEDKTAKTGEDANGKPIYTPTGETRMVNSVEKFFDTDGKTLDEKLGDKDASFINDWTKAFKDKDKDKSTKKPAGGAQAGLPSLGGAPTSTSPAAGLDFD